MSGSARIAVAGEQIAWGVHPDWLSAVIVGLAPGCRVARRRTRNRTAAVAFVQHPDGTLTQHHLALAAGGCLKLLPAFGANKKEVA